MQSVTLRARGLYTHPNNLSEAPEGSLSVADNVVIDRNSIIEPRRGLAAYGDEFTDPDDRCKQLITYKNRILRHYGDALDFDDGAGSFTAFSGTFEEPETDIKIKYLETNGNLYFTTNEGIKKISATSASEFSAAAGYIRDAGAAAALDVTGTVDYTNAGFFTDKSKVAYRVVWGYKDTNNNLILGSPSSRLVVTNFSDTLSGTVQLEFSIPSEITSANTEYFYQIYRTAVVQAATLNDLDDIDPGDEMNLVIEDFPTAAELSTTRVVSVEDITPEAFRVGGTLLYTNPTSGEGIEQANEKPPLAKDITLFRNTVFFANTQTKHNLQLALLSVTGLVSGVSTITISDGTNTTVYTFVGEAEVTDFTFDTQANTNDGGYFLINSTSNLRKYFVWFDKTGSTAQPTGLDIVDRIPIRVDISAAVTANDVAVATETELNNTIDFFATTLGAVVTVTNTNNGNCDDAVDGASSVGGVFAILVTTQGDGEDAASQEVLLSAAATPSQQIDETARSLVNIINKQASEIVEAFYLSGPDDVPGLILLRAKTLSQIEFFLTANSTTTGEQFNPTLPTSGTSVNSDNEVEPNALYFSKFQEPEAVPLVNKFSVGPKDKAILRILASRDSLFILKEDAIYRLTGTAGSFNIDPFDNSTLIAAADSAVVLNNQVYILSNQGVATVTDTGVSIISRPIEDKLSRIISSAYSYKTNTFGVSYETDRAYLLWTVTTVNDTEPTQCFRYNTFTNTWTRFPISKTAGVVNPFDDKLYVGAADEPFIEKERKDFKRTDYADREFELSLLENAINENELTLSSALNVDVGDVLVQIQYLTIGQFNQLLKQLDIDPNVEFTDYFSSLGVSPGANLRDGLDALAAKLDTDGGIVDTTFAASIGSSSDFPDLQDDFNIIIGKLNADPGPTFNNYQESVGTVPRENIVLDKVQNTSIVITKFVSPFIEGPITVFKGIPSDVIWNPQHMGDPSIRKQINQGTFLFENTVFFLAEVGYSTDLSPDFEFIEFDEAGIGDWGLFIWNSQNWGGEGSQVPLRTYIPRDKQRCRFIKPRFRHDAAREKFSLFGVSLTFRAFSERAYRA